MLAFGPAESNDESLKALDFILEAWEEGTGSGIAPELMAYAAIYTALTDLVAAFGEESVMTLVNGLGAARREGRVHALPLAAVAPGARRSAYQKRRRFTTSLADQHAAEAHQHQPGDAVDLAQPHLVQVMAHAADALGHQEPVEKASAHGRRHQGKASTWVSISTNELTPPKIDNQPSTAPGLVMVSRNICGISQT